MSAPGTSDDFSWDFGEDQVDEQETPIDDVAAVYQQLMKDGTNRSEYLDHVVFSCVIEADFEVFFVRGCEF